MIGPGHLLRGGGTLNLERGLWLDDEDIEDDDDDLEDDDEDLDDDDDDDDDEDED
jgi:hypothetical protein